MIDARKATTVREILQAANLVVQDVGKLLGFRSRGAIFRKLAGTRRWKPEEILMLDKILRHRGVEYGGLERLMKLCANDKQID